MYYEKWDDDKKQFHHECDCDPDACPHGECQCDDCRPETEDCPTCGGSGFSGLASLAGNGYDAVCDTCGGQGEVLKIFGSTESLSDI